MLFWWVRVEIGELLEERVLNIWVYSTLGGARSKDKRYAFGHMARLNDWFYILVS